MSREKKSNDAVTSDNSFSFRDYLTSCVDNWKWFVISILVICSLAYLYVMRQEPKFLREEQVLIKDIDGSGGADLVASSFNNMGLGVSNKNVYNELVTFSSPALLSQVIIRLDLQNTYVKRGFPHGTSLYGSNLPFKVLFLDLNEGDAASFKITYDEKGNAELTKFRRYMASGTKMKYHESVRVPAGFQIVRTPVGRVQFVTNPAYVPVPNAEPEEVTYYISHAPLQSAVDNYKRRLGCDLADKDADIINLTFRDSSVERAVDVLKTIVEVYNQDWIDDRNKIAVATSKFIDERLVLLNQQLGTLDTRIADFQSRTMLPDINEATKVNLQATVDLSQDMIEVMNKLGMARFVKEYIDNPANIHNVIPVNTGIESPQLEVEISNYNSLLLMRNNLVQSTSVTNPIVRDYDEQLKGMRESIQRGIRTHVAGMERAVSNLEGARSDVKHSLSSSPAQAKYIVGEKRQQTVMEQLYLFLLQKREENELSQTFTANNIRIITPPYGPLRPVEPKKTLVLAIAFLLSVALPAGLIYVKEASDNKIRSRHDLEKMAAPFAGEIPFVGKKKRFAWLRDKLAKKSNKHKKLETVPVTVKAGNRDMINESFRIVRSNIDFMHRGADNRKVIMVTSFNPGSGKSFVTFNLAASFAIKGKKVLIIDCDLRHGSSSQFVGMPSRGVSNYLTGGNTNWKDTVVAVKDTPGLYVLPIGHRPPNPAELLDNGRMGELLKEAEEEYDYIFLDCPPVDVVVDTQVLEKYAQQTIFVVRAGLLERAALAEIDAMYRNHRFQSMSILLNGTERNNSRYGVYGSSYYSSDF